MLTFWRWSARIAWTLTAAGALTAIFAGPRVVIVVDSVKMSSRANEHVSAGKELPIEDDPSDPVLKVWLAYEPIWVSDEDIERRHATGIFWCQVDGQRGSVLGTLAVLIVVSLVLSATAGNKARRLSEVPVTAAPSSPPSSESACPSGPSP